MPGDTAEAALGAEGQVDLEHAALEADVRQPALAALQTKSRAVEVVDQLAGGGVRAPLGEVERDLLPIGGGGGREREEEEDQRELHGGLGGENGSLLSLFHTDLMQEVVLFLMKKDISVTPVDRWGNTPLDDGTLVLFFFFLSSLVQRNVTDFWMLPAF